ncbi:MAG TPA: Maf family protein [Humisphaera sp.]|jgi:septum formation protein|nr:Maf family protein [Humisphaera sp.]
MASDAGQPQRIRRLVLASASPRRRDLLTQAGFVFEIIPADIDEEAHPPGMSAAELARWLAIQKANVIADRYPDDVVLGADTVVSLNHQILGKPADADHAFNMLKSLSGTTHQVITGIAIISRQAKIAQNDIVVSSVQMRAMSDREIADYVASEKWMGKAGGYGIQDRDPFVTRIAGDLTNIVGLPMERTAQMLAEVGILPAGGRRGPVVPIFD